MNDCDEEVYALQAENDDLHETIDWLNARIDLLTDTLRQVARDDTLTEHELRMKARVVLGIREQ